MGLFNTMLKHIVLPTTQRALRTTFLARQYSSQKMSAEQLEALSAYGACDISDALLKLEVPGAGFLADLSPIPSAPPSSSQSINPSAEIQRYSSSQKIIAPASTILFVPKSSPSFPDAAPPLKAITQTLTAPNPNIPNGTPYSDLTTPDTVVIVSQPREQVCAVVGGIMALRMSKMGARGIVVDGRVRDLDSLRQTGIPIYSRAISTIGAAAESKAWATQVPIAVGETTVAPGDIVMMDPEARAVVSIPFGLLDQVINLLPGLVEADANVLRDVEAGGEVGEAFRKYRGKQRMTQHHE